MKTNLIIPIPKEEDVAALNKRRENYAASRDLQATEFNESIKKRLLAEAKHLVKCNICGKEFANSKTEEVPASCPECSSKPVEKTSV